jgi:uncharacterized membrane protein YeaQ/YmgE (transglycosylase-associated protein family)
VGVLSWIAVGLIAGLLARAVIKDSRAGCIYTIVIGILGGLIGGALMQAIGHNDSMTSFSLTSVLVAFLGACLLLLVLGAISGRAGSRSHR